MGERIERGSQREGNDFGLLTNLLVWTIESSLAASAATTTTTTTTTTITTTKQ